MKEKVFLFIIFTLILILSLSSCQTTNSTIRLTEEQKQEDFLFLYNLLEKEYPLFGVKSRRYGLTWLGNKERSLNRILNTDNDTEFYNEMSKIFNLGSHTYIVSLTLFNMFINDSNLELVKDDPLCYEFHYKALKSAVENYDKWCSVIEFEDYNVKNQNNHNSYFDFSKYHNDETLYLKISSFLQSSENCEQIKKYIVENKSCSNIIIDIRGNSGGHDYQWLQYIVKPLINSEYQYPKIMAFKDGYYCNSVTDIILNNNLNTDKHNISNLPEGLNYPPEILTDFSYYITEHLTVSPENSIEFSGDIYVLIDDRVYSSAEGFANFCKQTGFATLVGKRTKGDGGGISPILVQLPNSGLLFRMRLQMTLNPDGTASAEYGTSPDIEVKVGDLLQETLKIIENKRK